MSWSLALEAFLKLIEEVGVDHAEGGDDDEKDGGNNVEEDSEHHNLALVIRRM